MNQATDQNQTSQSSNAARTIIINVDDLGLSTAVNDAVLHLAEIGRIGASSYMVGGAISDNDISELKRRHVDVGLHLDLTGIFPSALRGSLKSIIIASYLRRFSAHQVTDIIKQQLDRFEDRFNQAPVFIDGHQHIHQFPIIRHCLINELSARYRHQISQGSLYARVTTPLIHDIKSWIIYLLGGYGWRKSCDHNHIKINDKFGGVYNFEATGQELVTFWESWIKNAPLSADLLSGILSQDSKFPTINSRLSPTLIMCHPAAPYHNWQDDIKAAREMEYQWLISAEFKDLSAKYNVRLMRWSDMK